MNVLSPWLQATWLQAEWAERIGWTLVHSVWQVAIVAAAYAAAAFALRRRSANLRYVLGCVALAAMIVWSAATLLLSADSRIAPSTTLNSIPREPVSLAADAGPSEAVPPTEIGPAPQPSLVAPLEAASQAWSLFYDWLTGWRERIESALPWLSVGWLTGVMLLALRPIWGLVVVRRLKTRGLTPLSTDLRQLAGRLMVRLRVTAAVQFAESALVEVPTVVGYLRPMVLLPASAATGLSMEQLEMVLAHELAHVRRHDYLVNLLQTAIEALLFFHPGMWWVSAQVRRERENCCDDVAMSVCGDRKQYVRALYTLESLRRSAEPALAASGGSLVERVRRLVLGPQAAPGFDRATAWLAGLMVLGVVVAVLSLGRSYADEQLPESLEVAADEPASSSAPQPIVTEYVQPTTLTGRILYAGAPPAPRNLAIPLTMQFHRGDGKIDSTEVAGRRRYAEMGIPDESLIVAKDGGIANVVVWARDKNLPTPPFSGELPPSTIRSEDGRFEPHVLAFWNVAPFRWVNAMDDGVNFNWSAIRNPRNMTVPVGQRREFEISRSEPIPTRLTSNVQPWMTAYALPLAHPYFAVTGRDGRFEIKNLPPGTWEFAIWHERAGWLRTDRFESGKFKWTVRPGENALGDLRVDPNQMGATSNDPNRDEEPAPKSKFKRPDKLPPLPTLDALTDKSLIERQIDAAFAQIEEHDEGHVIVGRLLVEGDDDPTLVTAQMEILGGGYFAGATRDLQRPVGFVMQGYEPLMLSLFGKSGTVVDVGTIQLKRLPPEKLVSAVGRVELEDSHEFERVDLQFVLESPSVNTPSNGTSPRPRWPEPVTVKLDSGGRFYQPDFSPVEYTLILTAPGFVKHSQQVNFADEEIKNLGTIRLERPRRLEIDYVVTRDTPIPLDKVEQVVLEGGSRWKITPHPYRWDLEFKQKNGRLLFAWSYGPVYLADLGQGELKDFARISGTTAQSAPNEVPLRNGHVYLLRRPDWENGSEDLVLFKIRTNSSEPTEARPIEARPMSRPSTEAVRSLIQSDANSTRPRPVADVDRLDSEGFSQLHRAASGGHVQRVRELLDAGANVNVEQAKYRGTPLQYAAHQGHGETVQVLLDRGANVDARDANHRTPLIWATMGGHADVIRRLLDAGADINATNDGRWTPLHYAVDGGHVEAAQLLIDRGADVRARNSQGRTPVDLKPGLELIIPWRALQTPVSTTKPMSARSERRFDAGSTAPPPPALAPLPDHQPTDVIGQINGQPILWNDLAPPADWLKTREEHIRKHGFTSGVVALDDYRMEQLMKRIWTPLYDEFAKIHDTTPAEVELEEFAERTRAAEEKRHRDLVAEKERLTQELVALKQKAGTMNLPPEEYDAIKAQMLALTAQYERLEKRESLTRPLMDEKQKDFFARWYVGNWKKQRALYKKYGGRVIYQQVGPEAIDAMRDFLKENETKGAFAIHDPILRERFWAPFVKENPGVLVSDPDRVFEHPWSQLDEQLRSPHANSAN